MTKKEAIQNLQNLINVSLQRGIFATVDDVIIMNDSLMALNGGEITMNELVIDPEKSTTTK